jgi:hypothetical protein
MWGRCMPAARKNARLDAGRVGSLIGRSLDLPEFGGSALCAIPPQDQKSERRDIEKGVNTCGRSGSR